MKELRPNNTCREDGLTRQASKEEPGLKWYILTGSQRRLGREEEPNRKRRRMGVYRRKRIGGARVRNESGSISNRRGNWVPVPIKEHQSTSKDRDK